MKNNQRNMIGEYLATAGLILTAVLLLNPFDFWMPDMMVICILAIILVSFGFFASFILREKSLDERDDQHKALAGRNAFLGGSFVIIIGIIIQGYTHNVDPWLIISLTVMIVTKVGTRMWSDKNL